MKKKIVTALVISLLSFSALSTSFAAKSLNTAPATNGMRAWAG